MLTDAILAPCAFAAQAREANFASTSEDTDSFLRSAVWNGLHAQNVVDRLIRPSIDGWLARTHPTVLRRKLQYPCITDPPTSSSDSFV